MAAVYINRHYSSLHDHLLSPETLPKLSIKEETRDCSDVFLSEDDPAREKSFFDQLTHVSNENMFSSSNESIEQNESNNWNENWNGLISNYPDEQSVHITTTDLNERNSCASNMNSSNYSFNSFNDPVFNFKENNSPLQSPTTNLPPISRPHLPALILTNRPPSRYSDKTSPTEGVLSPLTPLGSVHGLCGSFSPAHSSAFTQISREYTGYKDSTYNNSYGNKVYVTSPNNELTHIPSMLHRSSSFSDLQYSPQPPDILPNSMFAQQQQQQRICSPTMTNMGSFIDKYNYPQQCTNQNLLNNLYQQEATINMHFGGGGNINFIPSSTSSDTGINGLINSHGMLTEKIKIPCNEDIVNDMNSKKVGNKGYLCELCGKIYTRKYGLKIHMRIHTGFKPLRCKFCQKRFGDPSNMAKHTRLHSIGDAPYKCQFCTKILVRRRDLDRHIKSRHPNGQ